MSNYSSSEFHDQENTSWFKVLSLIKPGARVLDIGCSSGNFGLELMKRKGCTVDGIEIDPEDFKEAKTKLGKVWRLNVETDSLKDVDHDYDVIYFGDVIEHLVQPVAALQKVQALLGAKGGIVFSIPNMAHVTVRLQLLKGTFDYTETGLLDKTHLHFYTLEEVQRVFAEAGYVIQKLEFTEKDYPDELVANYLYELGLTADEKFYTRMHKPDAAAFQFVGYAVPGKTNPKKRLQFGPIDMFESYFTNTVQPLRDRIQHLEGVVHELELKNHELEQRFRNLARHPVRTLTKSVKRRARRIMK
jgi:2-polyprenyl-3-methyl-5-hydroxy-6-metoxy-1,4-benzoquinol methylase